MAQLEVLAPAGSRQALEAAVACGADAVYLGIDRLNARRNAENFTMQNLAETVRFCHIHGVKVYLTLNIVVLDSEITDLLEAAQAACEAGVDAVIVQDFGAAGILRRCCPSLRLNASTQMAVHNIEGVRILEDMGFSRVVLARECSREEIAAIASATSLEVEVFVHGALCMCISGQCYMSSVLGQRSGNRGLCAQPCRLPFSTPASSHALSLKDMSLIARMDQLLAAGVASLKIEGRMKRPEYVAAAVTACRAALAGEPVGLDTLQAVFSRSGFTDGYFSGNRTIDMFGIREKEDVTAATGVLGELENLYTNPRKRVQKVGVQFDFSMQPGVQSALTARDMDGNQATVYGEIPQAALHKPTDRERAEAALCKTGGTPYHVESVSCSIAPGLMLPASAINALRRDALAQLDECRGKPKATAFDPACAGTPPQAPRRDAPELRVRLNSAEQLTPTVLEHAALITLPADKLLALLESGQFSGSLQKLCAGVPRILFSGQDSVRGQLERLRGHGVQHASVGNLGSIGLVSGLEFILHGESFLNITNSYAAWEYAQLGLGDLELSFELSLDAAKKLRSPIPVGVDLYGKLSLMSLRNCPVRAAVGCGRCKNGENFIADRKGNRLETSCAYGITELYNPVPLYMGDRMRELGGLDFGVLRFTTESPEECSQIIGDYLSGAPAGGTFTRGLLYKAIL